MAAVHDDVAAAGQAVVQDPQDESGVVGIAGRAVIGDREPDELDAGCETGVSLAGQAKSDRLSAADRRDHRGHAATAEPAHRPLEPDASVGPTHQTQPTATDRV